MIPIFIPLIFNPKTQSLNDTRFLDKIDNLLLKYKNHLFDDYNAINSIPSNYSDYPPNFSPAFELIKLTSPCFWVVLEDKTNKFAGFGYLDNWIGNKELFHSACISTCFEKNFRGAFAKNAAKTFLDIAFSNFNFLKIKAEIFSSNPNPIKLLTDLGFQLEAELKSETKSNNQPVDLKIYSLFNKNYYLRKDI